MAEQFSATSTTDDVLAGVDLTGKRILITGVSAGLGVETARALIAHGATVVGAARDLEKAKAATAGIGAIELIELDLASLKSVRTCADALVAAGKKFDVVINNAGVMACPFGHTADGFETQFGTNHLGHFVFTNRILPVIAPGGRVVSLASSGHRFAGVNLEDPNFVTTEYAPFVAYGRSKTANILFAVEFDRRHKAAGIRAVAVHPGGIATELTRHMPPGALESMVEDMSKQQEAAGGAAYRLKTVPQGAATSVWAAVVAPVELVAGKYCENCNVAELLDGESDVSMISGGVRPYAIDAEIAKALWAKSEAMVGETF